MLDELRPMGLSDAARSLNVDPFEVVRLMVAFDSADGALHLDAEEVEKLRARAGIEEWWRESRLPEDANRLRAAVRGAMHQLISRRILGDLTTRLDNLWRGLALDQQVAIEQAVMVLIEEGKLLTAASPRGVQVSVTPGAEDAIDGLANGTLDHQALAAVWQGS